MPLILSKNLESDPVCRYVADGEDGNKQVIQRSRSQQCQFGAGAAGSGKTRYQVAGVVVSFASMNYDLPGEGVGVPALLRTVMRYTGTFETESATAENAAPGPGDIDGHSWWRSSTRFWNGWPADDLSIPAVTKDPYVRRVNDENA